MSKQSRLTVKGQVTIPKDVRDALGLKPGEPVEFVVNDRGEAVIRKPDAEATRRNREEELLRKIEEVRIRFRAQDTMPGISNDEYMLWVRGPAPEV
jgi:AbrB family looped-hinge helix DNA binding protein